MAADPVTEEVEEENIQNTTQLIAPQSCQQIHWLQLQNLHSPRHCGPAVTLCNGSSYRQHPAAAETSNWSFGESGVGASGKIQAPGM